jgi:hypothetical protein
LIVVSAGRTRRNGRLTNTIFANMRGALIIVGAGRAGREARWISAFEARSSTERNTGKLLKSAECIAYRGTFVPCAFKERRR